MYKAFSSRFLSTSTLSNLRNLPIPNFKQLKPAPSLAHRIHCFVPRIVRLHYTFPTQNLAFRISHCIKKYSYFQTSHLGRVNPRRHSSMATSDPNVPPSVDAAPPSPAHKTLSSVEASKRRAAYKAVEDHFDISYKYIGIGSGSTVVYVVEAIAAKGRDITNRMIFVPTGDQVRL